MRRVSAKGMCVLLLTLLMGGVTVVLCAQQQQPQTQQEKPEHHRAGPGQEMVHASNEAVGREDSKEEKDARAEFKHSPSVQMISRITGLSPQQAYWASELLNFVVIAAIIIWAGRKFLPGIFRDRTTAIQRAMQEAQKASEEARRKLAQIESRLQKLDVEIGMMRDAAEKEGAAEDARIKAAAEEDARKIIAAAEQEVDATIKAARRQLVAYAADLAVGLAQKQIQVDPATDQALVRNFANQLNSTPEGSRKDGN
jgi:F-type H+-transporting ATPase subunit b